MWRGIQLVIAVGTHQEHAANLGAGEQRRQQPQRGGIGPLQIVEEQDQRVFRLCQRRHEVLYDPLKAVLRLDASELDRYRLCTDDELQFRHHSNQHAAVAAERGPQLFTP